MKNKPILVSIISLICLFIKKSSAYAATYTVTEGQDVAVAINPLGTIIKLPTFVKNVQEPINFVLKEITNNSADGKSSVNSFQLTAKGNNPQPERITFILANEKPVNVLVTPTTKGESYVELKFPPQGSRKSEVEGSPYLKNEMALMLAMLRDENKANRRVLKEKVTFPEYPQLSFQLVRDFRADGLTGFVFTVENKSNETLRVNATVLQFGRPNRAVMLQMDHDRLEPCHKNNSADPRGTGCVAAIRLVLRGQELQHVPQIYHVPRAGQGPAVVAERGKVK